MKKIIYILMSAALLCGCEGFYGSLDDGSQELVEIAAINRSSVPVILNVYGAEWADPEEAIYLKPHNGLWKTEASRENYYGQEILPVKYSVIRADFNNGERVIYFDHASDLPYNPCADYSAKEIWDDRYQHRIIEFSDKICEELYARQDALHTFNISMNFSPSDVVENLVVPGSTEGYFSSLFPVGDVKDKLKLGAAVYAEAESIDKVRFVDGMCYEVIKPETTDTKVTRYHQLEIYPYYDLEQLRKLGQTNFGCDFAALTGRSDGSFDSFCGIVQLMVEVGRTEMIADDEYPADFIAELENLSEPACVVDKIEYGNFMILLAEADCSHTNIYTYVTQKLLRNDPSEYYYYEEYYTPEITFHLITLDENGKFICQTGGEELAAVFHKGFEAPDLHPLSYHVTDMQEDTTYIHVK